ncbi:mTERF domain-containing protein [Plasmodium brasilianum]|nr:mTERF domain-containing protein [Plasmodium brasilianum]
MNKYFFYVLVPVNFISLICYYVKCAKVVYYSNSMRKNKDIHNIKIDRLPFKYHQNKNIYYHIRYCYDDRNKNRLFFLRTPSSSMSAVTPSSISSSSTYTTSYSRAYSTVQRKIHKRFISKKFQLFEKTSKYIENLKKVKKIDNTILGNNFNDKEGEIIDQIPDRFLNAFKWALEFKLKNFNCKFKRITKLAKKNNEELKSLDNYAIGYKENLLAMLQKDKNFFLDIVKKLKSKEYFNFDIYSIFKFINIDIRFLFYPECHNQSAIFFLIFGNLEKAVNYFLKNKQNIDFMQMPKYIHAMSAAGREVHISVKQRKRLMKAQRKKVREEKRKAHMAAAGGGNSGQEMNEGVSGGGGSSGQEMEEEGVSGGAAGGMEDDLAEGGQENLLDKLEEGLVKGVQDDIVTKEKNIHMPRGNCASENEILNPNISLDSINISSNIEEKFNFFLKNYDEIEYFFTTHFKTSEELKSFFEKFHENENKIKKEEVTFNSKGDVLTNIKEVIPNGINLEMIKKIIKTSPRLSLINKKTVLKRLAHYKNELNYSYNELKQILYNLPQFFAFGNLKRKYNELLYLDESIEEEDLKKFIKKYPRIFTYNVYRTIRPKMLYLIRHLNKSFHDTLSFPQYFSYSFRLRIIPRHVAYMNLYYDNYIEFYKELVRKYNYADFNKNFNDLVYKPNIPPINLKMLLQTSNKDFIKHYKIPYYDFVRSSQLAKNIHNPFILV